jgi:branched-subunit amino acid transport protein
VAGSWLKNRDPQAADVFYKALVRRCPKTDIGKEADRIRWFPMLDENGKVAPRKPPPPAPPGDREEFPASSGPPERFAPALRGGLRFALHAPALRRILLRAGLFFGFASAYWALLPLIVRQTLQGGPSLYGILLACVGVGAVSGALLLPRMKARLGADRLVAGGTLGMAAALLVLAYLPLPLAAGAVSFAAGAAWIAVLSSLNVSIQTALPDWVRARGLSVFVTVFFGAMSLGSLVWGQTASMIGISPTLLIAATGAVAASLLTRHWKLQQGGVLDLSPSMHWPAPLATAEVAMDRGPVLVTVEYRIDPAESGQFLAVLDDLGRARRRDGAYSWGVFEDVAEPGLYVEHFMVASWLEHLRQHDRVTVADRVIQDRIRTFLAGGSEPVVRHLLAPDPGEGEAA